MNNASIALEDTWVDVLQKALRGQGLTEESLAKRTGLSLGDTRSLLSGKLAPDHLLAAAHVLGLWGDRLLSLARGQYHPGSIDLPEGMVMLTSTWGEMLVHSYLAWDRTTRQAVAFDTGADASEMLNLIRDQQLKLGLILLTHGHGDHLFDLDRIVEKTGATAWIGEKENIPGVSVFAAGKDFVLGHLRIETRSTHGHAPGGITYVIHGLESPVAVVGDALFAGSMGGPNVSYADCLRTNRKEILSLPPETILGPGHGPLTSVGLERANNPFFPPSLEKAVLDHPPLLEEAPFPTKESR
jgi:glyoxylase-like metal-dependent hydrolase (beta-lactamase superfamily II)